MAVAVAPPVAPPPPAAAAPPKDTAADRKKAERERAAAEKSERAEKERLSREEKADRERAARADREKAAQEKADRAKAEREARAEKDRLAKEERADREKAQRADREKAAADRAAADKAAADKARVAAVTPTPPPAGAKRKGLDPAEVKGVIARTGAAFDECVRAASGGPDSQYVGRSVDLYVEVSPSGGANDAFVDDDGLSNSQLGKCLKKAAMKMSFTPYDGEPVPVRVPLRLGQR
jgi:membrane protein involved in colicin uptake